jgi:hypothetical protein
VTQNKNNYPIGVNATNLVTLYTRLITLIWNRLFLLYVTWTQCYDVRVVALNNFYIAITIVELAPGSNPATRSFITSVVKTCNTTGVNPTIASYNASVVNFYNATGSLARFENKNIFYYFEKRSRCRVLLQRWRCSCKFKS